MTTTQESSPLHCTGHAGCTPQAGAVPHGMHTPHNTLRASHQHLMHPWAPNTRPILCVALDDHTLKANAVSKPRSPQEAPCACMHATTCNCFDTLPLYTSLPPYAAVAAATAPRATQHPTAAPPCSQQPLLLRPTTAAAAASQLRFLWQMQNGSSLAVAVGHSAGCCLACQSCDVCTCNKWEQAE